jgi:sarcosine oxidase subunit beta
MTPDGIPIIGPVSGMDGIVLAVGMCGQGFMMGPGVARNVTSMIVRGAPMLAEEVQRTFRFDRDFHAGKTEALK